VNHKMHIMASKSAGVCEMYFKMNCYLMILA